jgi:hypothetical protein
MRSDVRWTARPTGLARLQLVAPGGRGNGGRGCPAAQAALPPAANRFKDSCSTVLM